MATASLEQQWKELEPKKGFNFDNYARNIQLIKDKVCIFYIQIYRGHYNAGQLGAY